METCVDERYCGSLTARQALQMNHPGPLNLHYKLKVRDQQRVTEENKTLLHTFLSSPPLFSHLLLRHSPAHTSLALLSLLSVSSSLTTSPPSLPSTSPCSSAPRLPFSPHPFLRPRQFIWSNGALTGWSLCPLPGVCSCARALRRLPPRTHIHAECQNTPTYTHACIHL